MEKAQNALTKHNSGRQMTYSDWMDIVRWVLPESQAPLHLDDFKRKEHATDFLTSLEQPWALYIPPCAPQDDAAQQQAEMQPTCQTANI